MSQASNFNEGLTILLTYDLDNSFAIVSEHDSIWTAHGIKVSRPDRKLLNQFGWYWDKDAEAWEFVS